MSGLKNGSAALAFLRSTQLWYIVVFAVLALACTVAVVVMGLLTGRAAAGVFFAAFELPFWGENFATNDAA